MNSDDFKGFSFSWTQPYSIQPIQFSSVGKDMAIIEAVDSLVDLGLITPEADAIIKKLFNNS